MDTGENSSEDAQLLWYFKYEILPHPFPAFQISYEFNHFLYSCAPSCFIPAWLIMSHKLQIFLPRYAALLLNSCKNVSSFPVWSKIKTAYDFRNLATGSLLLPFHFWPPSLLFFWFVRVSNSRRSIFAILLPSSCSIRNLRISSEKPSFSFVIGKYAFSSFPWWKASTNSSMTTEIIFMSSIGIPSSSYNLSEHFCAMFPKRLTTRCSWRRSSVEKLVMHSACSVPLLISVQSNCH